MPIASVENWCSVGICKAFTIKFILFLLFLFFPQLVFAFDLISLVGILKLTGGTSFLTYVLLILINECLSNWNFQEHSKLIDMDHGEGDYCSVNVDQVDMFKYPSLQNLPWWSARLEPGDCLFIPYGWEVSSMPWYWVYFPKSCLLSGLESNQVK